MKFKMIVLMAALSFSMLGHTQQGVNILPVEQWTPGGPDGVGDFARMGSVDENYRVFEEGPYKNSVLVWEGSSELGDNSGDGGFQIEFPVDENKTYQYSVWVRNPNNNTSGKMQLRAKSNSVLKMDGAGIGLPYLYFNTIPNDNNWYLLVGYLHNSATTETVSRGRLYRADGTVYRYLTDYKFKVGTSIAAFLCSYRNALDIGNKHYFWQPRVEEVNGNETSAVNLISAAPPADYVHGNYLESDKWTVGTSDFGRFEAFGNVTPPNEENERVVSNGPYEDNVVVWKTKSEGANNNSGGLYHDHLQIDVNTTYRYMVWVKQYTALGCGSILFGAKSSSNYRYLNILDDSPATNPYFWGGDVPELDKWYLLVGYIHGTDYTGTASRGGVYDVESGERIFPGKDFKFRSTATNSLLRIFNHKCLTAAAGIEIWNPIIEIYDESSKPISTYFLGKDVLWRAVGADDAVYKRTGTIGIGLANDDVLDPAYKLMVDGTIKTREVKVNPDSWADFVFEADYELPSLLEVEKHIREKGYLPNIPSAAEVKREGVNLGEMDAKLLRKIEELTLYLIEKNEKINGLVKTNEDLLRRLEVLEEQW